MDKRIDLLREIKPVEASPFLFTRIEQKIKSAQKELLQPKWVISAAFSVLLLLSINFIAVKKYSHNDNMNGSTEMNLYPDNSLYK